MKKDKKGGSEDGTENKIMIQVLKILCLGAENPSSLKEILSGQGTRVYLWQIHFDIWQNQYNIVKFKNKIK